MSLTPYVTHVTNVTRQQRHVAPPHNHHPTFAATRLRHNQYPIPIPFPTHPEPCLLYHEFLFSTVHFYANRFNQFCYKGQILLFILAGHKKSFHLTKPNGPRTRLFSTLNLTSTVSSSCYLKLTPLPQFKVYPLLHLFSPSILSLIQWSHKLSRSVACMTVTRSDISLSIISCHLDVRNYLSDQSCNLTSLLTCLHNYMQSRIELGDIIQTPQYLLNPDRIMLYPGPK